MKVLLVTAMRCPECGMDLFLHSIHERSEDGMLQWQIEHPKYEYCTQEGTRILTAAQLEPREI